MENKEFDLNIEKILENWDVHHAIREIIANALDEQKMTNTKTIEIYKNNATDKKWHIRDYGRGLHYKHLTQNENQEKIKNENLIGQFGIGLKDALATLNRKNIKVNIFSKHLNINEMKLLPKKGFEDTNTLHLIINKPEHQQFQGTLFSFEGVDDIEIEKAKNLFLEFSNLEVQETTKYGQIIKKNHSSNIYLNGVKVAEEENFLFSYNITSLDKKIKKSLNRERTNVGRNAYSDRIKLILKNCKNEIVLKTLGENLKMISEGTASDEIQWVDVQEHVIKHLNACGNYIFLTGKEKLESMSLIAEAISSGKTRIIIPETLKNRIQGVEDIFGEKINDLNNYAIERQQNFQFEFIDKNDLKPHERKIFDKTDEIIELIGSKPKQVTEIKIAKKMQQDIHSFNEATGLWIPEKGLIIIKRDQLKLISTYAGTLLHEIIHAKTGFSDVNREFETHLSYAIGLLTSKIIKI